MNNDSWTPLHIAVRKGHIEAIKSILEFNNSKTDNEKFDLNHQGGVCLWTPLHLAAHGGVNDLIELLFQEGADVLARNIMG
jgi:ankyrin repeat protein